MRFELLADNQGAIDTVARWYFDEWGSETPGASLERIRAEVSRYVSRSGPPLIVVAKVGDIPVAAAELKVREMSIYPQFEHWLGGVYVRREYRGRGIGTEALRQIRALLAQKGHERIWLTVQSTNVPAIRCFRKVGFHFTSPELEPERDMLLEAEEKP